MAQKGTYTAYQSARPLEADFTTPVQRVVEEQRYQQEKREKARKERQAKKEKLAKDFAVDYSTLTDVVTNNKTIDEAFARGIGTARDQMGELYRMIQQNPSLSSDVATQMKLQNLRNYSKNLKTISDKYTSYAQTVAKGMQDGSLSDWNSETLSDMDSLFASLNLNVTTDYETGMPKGVIAQVDENGEPVYDEDGDIVLKDMNLIEVLDGRGMTNLVQKYDFLKGVQEIGSNVGEDITKESASGFRTIERKKFEDVEDDVRGLLKGQLGSVKRPSPIAKSVWADAMGREAKDLTEEDLREIEDYFVEAVGTFYNESYEDTIDYSARTAASKEARQREKDKKTEEGVILSMNDGKPVKASHSQAGPNISGEAYEFVLREPKEVKIGGNPVTVDKLFYNEEKDKIFYRGTVYKGKKTKKSYSKGFVESRNIREDVTETVINEEVENLDVVAPRLAKKYSTIDSLKEDMKNQIQEKSGQGGEIVTKSGNTYVFKK